MRSPANILRYAHILAALAAFSASGSELYPEFKFGSAPTQSEREAGGWHDRAFTPVPGWGTVEVIRHDSKRDASGDWPRFEGFVCEEIEQIQVCENSSAIASLRAPQDGAEGVLNSLERNLSQGQPLKSALIAMQLRAPYFDLNSVEYEEICDIAAIELPNSVGACVHKVTLDVAAGLFFRPREDEASRTLSNLAGLFGSESTNSSGNYVPNGTVNFISSLSFYFRAQSLENHEIDYELAGIEFLSFSDSNQVERTGRNLGLPSSRRFDQQLVALVFENLAQQHFNQEENFAALIDELQQKNLIQPFLLP